MSNARRSPAALPCSGRLSLTPSRFGLDIGGLTPTDRHVKGVVEMMLDATQGYDRPLTARRLYDWHAAPFPTGHSRMSKIRVGSRCDDARGPMQVVSVPMGKEKVQYKLACG
jgi:hypothetical protein